LTVTLRIACLLALVAFPTLLHAASKKEALLIANGNYRHFPGLANPLPDAEKLGEVLKSLGFRVRIVRNGSREDMLDGIKEFENSVRGTQAIAFFHYGGHGVQVGGKNYLLPADADIPDERRVATRAVELDEVMGALEAANAKANVVVIDACRNNPLPTVAGRDSLRGLSVVGTKPKNSIIIYAAEAGSVAVDGLFTPIFASALSTKGRTIEQIMKVVRTEVYEKSGRQQTPGEYNQLFEELFLGESDAPDPKDINAATSLSKLLAVQHAPALDATAELSSPTTEVGQPVEIVVSVRVHCRFADAPERVDLPGLTIQRFGRQTRFEMNNFKISSYLTFTYLATPERAGKIDIPPFEIRVDDRTLKTNSLSLAVFDLNASEKPYF